MIIASEFKPNRWLANPHLQTIVASKLRRVVKPPLRWQRIELPDGDFIDLSWDAGRSVDSPVRPIFLVLHGLTGSVESSYAKAMLHVARAAGYCGVVMHLRGAGPHMNRLPRSYHSGESRDIGWVVDALRRQYPDNPLVLVGFSLGGNALLKWLGECGRAGQQPPIRAAAAISVPFQLEVGAERMSRGLSRIYQAQLVGNLKQDVRDKFARMDCPIDLSGLDDWNDFYQFDDRVTAQLNGFDGADDYYARCSSRQFIPDIRTDTLILHARDDPFMKPSVVPTEDEVPDPVTLELSDHGGHVGFVGGQGRRLDWWLDRRIGRFLKESLGR